MRLTFHEERIIKNKKVSIQDDNYEDAFERCSTPSKRAIVIAREKGASSWLNTPPLRKYAYVLTKAELRVWSVCLRYSWWMPNTPITCGCRKTSDLDNLMTCEWYVTMAHNHIRDSIAYLLREICHDAKLNLSCRGSIRVTASTLTLGHQARLDALRHHQPLPRR